MKSAQDDRLLSANDVINLIFKMAPRLIKRVYRTHRFHVAVHLFSNRSQETSKCGKNISDTRLHTCLLLPHFEVICDLLLNRDMQQHGTYLLNIQCSSDISEPKYTRNTRQLNTRMHIRKYAYSYTQIHVYSVCTYASLVCMS